MEKISVIKSIQGAGHFDNQHGRLFSFEYQFEDGTILKANHKTTPSPFKEGDRVAYTITKTNEYGNLGTVSKPKEDVVLQKTGSNPSSFALSYAKDFAIAQINNGAKDVVVSEVLKIADEFYKWLKEK